MDRISEVIQRIQPIVRVSRITYQYDMDEEIKIIESIGKSLTDRFRIDENNEFTYTNLIKYFMGDKSFMCINPFSKDITIGDLNKGIYIGGNPGSGKSICMEVFNKYTKLCGLTYSKGTEILPLTFTNFRSDDIVDEFCKIGNFDRYKDRYILSIQDFGAECTESYYMGNKYNVLKKIIEYRGDMPNAFTFITSNLHLNGQKLLGLYGDRVQSRLFAMCNYYTMTGVDRRK